MTDTRPRIYRCQHCLKLGMLGRNMSIWRDCRNERIFLHNKRCAGMYQLREEEYPEFNGFQDFSLEPPIEEERLSEEFLDALSPDQLLRLIAWEIVEEKSDREANK